MTHYIIVLPIDGEMYISDVLKHTEIEYKLTDILGYGYGEIEKWLRKTVKVDYKLRSLRKHKLISQILSYPQTRIFGKNGSTTRHPILIYEDMGRFLRGDNVLLIKKKALNLFCLPSELAKRVEAP